MEVGSELLIWGDPSLGGVPSSDGTPSPGLPKSEHFGWVVGALTVNEGLLPRGMVLKELES